MTTNELSKFLGIGVRRIQQLSKAGILPQAERGEYNDPAGCTRAYIQHLKQWQSATKDPISMADLARCCDTSKAKISMLIRKGLISKLGRGRYDLASGVQAITRHLISCEAARFEVLKKEMQVLGMDTGLGTGLYPE